MSKLEKYLSVFLLAGVSCGFLFPKFLQDFEGFIIYIIMTIMGFVFLKVDLLEVVTHIKKPFQILYMALTNLILIPLILFFTFFNKLGTDLSMGLLLLSSLPAGVSSAAFTDIMKGRTSLNLTLIIVTNLLATFTIPFLFWTLFKTDLQIDHTGLFLNLLKILAIPFFIAKVIKHVIFKDIVYKLQPFYNMIIILLLTVMVMISIAFQSEYILTHINELTNTLGILFLAFLLFQLLGYASVFWLTKGERVAVSNSKMIMNNVLGIVLAIAFFNDEVVTLMILSLVPWTIMISLKHFYKRFLP